MWDYKVEMIDIIAVSIIVLLFLLIFYFSFKNKRQQDKKMQMLDSLMMAFKPSTEKIEDIFSELLTCISTIIKAPSYAIYLLDEKKDELLLKSVRHKSNDKGQIKPDYSGLAPYEREVFFMPASVPMEAMKNKMRYFKMGRVKFISVPMGNQGIVLIGPLKIAKNRELDMLSFIRKRLELMVFELVEIDKLKNQVKLISSSDKAVKSISTIFSDVNNIVDILIKVSIRIVGADGGMFIENKDTELIVKNIIGLEDDTINLIRNDTKIFQVLSDIATKDKITVLNKADKDFFRIPPYFISEGVEKILLWDVEDERSYGTIVLWYKEDIKIKDHEMSGLNMMSKRLIEAIENNERYKDLSNSYINILKNLSKLLDNIKPSTVGYSELMYRYSIVIAKELGLDDDEVKDISLAAYLSNIGVIGLSDQVLDKKGEYSEIEYEMMKLHSDVGATIVESTIGNQRVADYIRYHHERIDGYGYPRGLKDDEIPIGSKIIGTVQTFLAKILSRDYRSPISFEDSITQIKTLSGTQLDKDVVGALTSWVEKKQIASINKTGALGYCWEMRCSPESVCTNCLAYKDTSRNCWEFDHNNCLAHGNKCEDCFVYSEFVYRKAKKDDK